MKLEYVPLLSVQRDLYRILRGFQRFRTYLATMIDPQTRDLKIPIVSMNPMGKEHAAAKLCEYIGLDADAIAARVTAQAEHELDSIDGAFKVALVLADDAKGGWTNRHATEFGHRFSSQPYFKRGWIVGLLWTSEPPSIEAVRMETLISVYRAAHIKRHGFARSLREMLAQEGYAMALAGRDLPEFEPAALARTREIIESHLQESDLPVVTACFFGDDAAEALGFPRLGLTENAGLALALHDAKRAQA